MNFDLSPLTKALAPLWVEIKLLFTEHHFLTVLCGFFAVMLTISFYRFLRSISPALVALICLLMVSVLCMHWIATRTEPTFLSPAVDVVAKFLPQPYQSR